MTLKDNYFIYPDLGTFLKEHDMTMEELEDDVQDITRGTYNGALDIFDPWEINTKNVRNAVLDYVYGDIDNWDGWIENTHTETIDGVMNSYDVFLFGRHSKDVHDNKIRKAKRYGYTRI